MSFLPALGTAAIIRPASGGGCLEYRSAAPARPNRDSDCRLKNQMSYFIPPLSPDDFIFFSNLANGWMTDVPEPLGIRSTRLRAQA